MATQVTPDDIGYRISDAVALANSIDGHIDINIFLRKAAEVPNGFVRVPKLSSKSRDGYEMVLDAEFGVSTKRIILTMPK